ncbi:MAG: lysylphosphatidylglycerol synthase transmembrane domain-containing protein [Roseburia hominis]
MLALSVLFRGQNWSDLLLLIRKKQSRLSAFCSVSGIAFCLPEGYMIWRLLRLSGNDATLPGCIRYSFIGYFYSGITPSATGGQPAQPYEMCKDGNNASDSTVVLMVVALFYKLVLVVIGLMLPVVWLGHMRSISAPGSDCTWSESC